MPVPSTATPSCPYCYVIVSLLLRYRVPITSRKQG